MNYAKKSGQKLAPKLSVSGVILLKVLWMTCAQVSYMVRTIPIVTVKVYN